MNKSQILGTNCKWELDLPSGGKTVFSSDADLDWYLKDQYDNIINVLGDSFDPSKAVLYSLDPQQATLDKLNKVSKDVDKSKVVKTVLGNNGEDIESYYYVPGFIGVTKYLQEFGLIGENAPFVTPFDDATWTANTIETYIKGYSLEVNPRTGNTERAYNIDKNKKQLPPLRKNASETRVDYINRVQSDLGITIEAAEKLADEAWNINPADEYIKALKEDTWPILSKMGEDIHKVMELVFNGEDPNGYKYSYLNGTLLSQTISDAKNFKSQLQAKYGANCKFFTEFGILSNNVAPEYKEALQKKGYKGITGKIDLLVIDESGRGHIYDFKVSRHEVGNWDEQDNKVLKANNWWHSTKKQGASYQLAVYRKILEQYGITILDTHIVPIHTELEYENPELETKPTGITAVEVQLDSELVKTDVREIGAGRYGDKINKVLKNNITVTGASITKMDDLYKIMFGRTAVDSWFKRNQKQREDIKENPHYVRELKDGDYRKDPKNKYVIHYNGVTDWANNEDELNTKIDNLIEAKADKKGSSCLALAKEIEAAIANNSIDSLGSDFSEKTENFIKLQFGRYITDGWTLIQDENAIQTGIFRFTKGNLCEIVCISDEHLRTAVNLGLGTSLLGFTKKDKFVNMREDKEATCGNLEIMKGAIFAATNSDWFKDNQLCISEIRAVNPFSGEETTLENSEIQHCYESLKKEHSDTKIPFLSSGLFLSDISALIYGANSRLSACENYSLDGLQSGNDVEFTEEWIKTQIGKLKKRFSYLRNNDSYNADDPAWHAMVLLQKALNIYKGVFTYTESDKGKYLNGGISHLNGVMVSSMQYSPSQNLRELGEVLGKYAAEVRDNFIKTITPTKNIFEEFYKNHGIGAKKFDIFFSDKERLILKDPDSAEFNGDESARKLLKSFLDTIYKLRHPGATDADIQKGKMTGEYFELPLMKGKISRQIRNSKIKDLIINKWRDYKQLSQNVWSTDPENIAETYAERGELYNPFDLTGRARENKIAEMSYGYFETDLELIFYSACEAYTKSAVAKDYIPVLSAMRLALIHSDSYGGDVDKRYRMNNILEAFDKNVKGKFYGESIVDPNLKGVLRFLNAFKSMFTTMTLSLNFRSMLRETLQGTYQGITRAGVKMLPGVNEKEYIKAFTHVIQEAPKNFSSVSLLQQLNVQYSMANQSLSQLAGQQRLRWSGLAHLGKDTMFLTATAPDFLHRMSILVAKMMGDGCWEAHTLNKDGVLEYDFKKDKRFEHLIKGETSHKDYLKEKSLYLTMLDEFNKDGFRTKDGKELKAEDMYLPQAYTRKEAQGVKNYADLLYGHYDDESRSLLNDTFFGSFFMQYKTWVTSKLEQWTMTAGTYDTAKLKVQKDPVTGDDLYVKTSIDLLGTPTKEILTTQEYNALSEEEKKQCILDYEYEGIPMEGMLQNSWNLGKALFKWKDEDLKKIWNEPSTKSLFLLAMHDQWLMMLMAALVTFLFGKAIDATHPLDPVEVSRKLTDMGPVGTTAYNVIAGSMSDSQLHNILKSFSDDPPTIRSARKFWTSSMQVITGKQNIGYWATKNFGAISSFQGMFKRLDDATK